MTFPRLNSSFSRFAARFPDIADRALVIAGGVAANKALRGTLAEGADQHGFRLVAPPMELCTDNAAMIAWAAAERMAAGIGGDPLDTAPRSRWPLDSRSETVMGSGKRGAKV